MENDERHIRKSKQAYVITVPKRGLPKVKCRKSAMSAMRKVTLNIYYGNRVSVVVRGRESRPHGEGETVFLQYK